MSKTTTDEASSSLESLFPNDQVVVVQEPIVADGLPYRAIKRAGDVVLSLSALTILALPMIAIALIVRGTSEGPAIYQQTRVGKSGKEFRVYKFRSMYNDAEKNGAQWAEGDDPRVTPFGRIMRVTRLDETPQFFNVLKGEMSLVGPRPERPEFCEEFEEKIIGWNYRTRVKPGLTGLAQVNGGYELIPQEKIILDMDYLEHRSIALDAKILLKTVKVVCTGQGAR